MDNLADSKCFLGFGSQLLIIIHNLLSLNNKMVEICKYSANKAWCGYSQFCVVYIAITKELFAKKRKIKQFYDSFVDPNAKKFINIFNSFAEKEAKNGGSYNSILYNITINERIYVIFVWFLTLFPYVFIYCGWSVKNSKVNIIGIVKNSLLNC